VTALRNALTEGRIAQAYLFSGIRGVGKTSAARLLAKALNCEKGPRAEPCNECTICTEITRGADLDVLEVDAATYSKVEQVRELTESLKYGPARDRYKVVVLDEIHRLSRQAFDALLKIVEEPPAHLVFIFATTEIEAVPATVLSRCQEFHFRRVPSEVVARHLRALCDHEKLEASDTALRLVARSGEGSVRDAVALLDQLATFGGGTVTDEEAVRLLGGLDVELFRELLAAIVEGRPAAVRSAVAHIEEEGWDPRNVYGQFLAYCRDALHLALGGDAERVDLPREEASALAELARRSGYENLLRLSQQLLASEVTVRRSEAGTLAVEIAWLRAAELPKLTRIEEILAGGGARPAETARKARAADPPRPRREAQAKPPRPPEAPEPEPPAHPPSDGPAKTAGGAAGGDAAPAHRGTIAAFLEEVTRRKPPLAARLEPRRLTFEDGRLRIALPADELDALERSSNPQILEECARATWGPDTAYTLEAREPEPRAGEAAPETHESAAPGGAEDTAEDTTVQTVLDLFGGRVEAVEKPDSVSEDPP
jgi:DNA polymerase-3 subunit gamma/tau